jgi:DedD protein
MASDDTEITLGMGKLLGLFFLLAATCGVFFSIGYSLGKSTGREQALNDQPAIVASTPAESASSGRQDKPSAVLAVKAEAEPAPPDQSVTANSPSNLTFYKAVQQTGDSPQTSVKETHSAPAANTTAVVPELAPVVTAKSATSPSAVASTPPPQVTRAVPVTGPGTIVVQIAAVSREDDAVALAGALRKKNYNAFVVNNPITNDKLYHVQVGPFATLQDADAMKAKLTSEGYNPIVKR